MDRYMVYCAVKSIACIDCNEHNIQMQNILLITHTNKEYKSKEKKNRK